MAANKKAIYREHGIEYKAGKIFAPVVGWIPELLKRGNTKTGENVWTWSMLPGTGETIVEIGGKQVSVKGTCVCDCKGCYAMTGFYCMPNVKRSLAINTWLVNNYLDFVREAISAQLETIGAGETRIHAAGDFNTQNSDEYAEMWHFIASKYTSFLDGTYTKIHKFESLFDDLANANIVKSIIQGMGVNFGHCDYIINLYYALREMGKKVYICKCGIDKNQHCENCGVCASYDYVLFIEHSTEYKAEEDPLFPKLKMIIENQ